MKKLLSKSYWDRAEKIMEATGRKNRSMLFCFWQDYKKGKTGSFLDQTEMAIICEEAVAHKDLEIFHFTLPNLDVFGLASCAEKAVRVNSIDMLRLVVENSLFQKTLADHPKKKTEEIYADLFKIAAMENLGPICRYLLNAHEIDLVGVVQKSGDSKISSHNKQHTVNALAPYFNQSDSERLFSLFGKLKWAKNCPVLRREEIREAVLDQTKNAPSKQSKKI